MLIRKGDEIFAQIDIDSHEFDAFDEATAREVEQLADWLAEAYETVPQRDREPVAP